MNNNNKIYLALITLVASLGGLLFGFDMAVISGVLPFVREKFQLSAVYEGWFVSSALLGCIIGVSFSGSLSDKIGRKKMLFIAALLFLLSAIGCSVVSSLDLLIAARLLGGIGVGMASIVVPLYISEIAPSAIRGRLVTCYQLAITVGILLAYVSNSLLLNYSGQYAGSGGAGLMELIYVKEVWRGMFSVGGILAILFLAGLFFVPESPVWQKKAEGIQNDSDNTSYRELFSPRLRRAMLIGVLLPLFSQLSGINAIIYYGPSILNDAGIALENSLIGQIFFGLANLVFTFIAIWKVDNWGRRPLYLAGTAGAFFSLLVTGFLFAQGLTSGIFLVVSVTLFLACFAFSIGPLKFVVASEIFPTRIRGKALGISIMIMWIADTIMGQVTPILLAQVGTAGTFWVFGFFCLVAFFTVYKLLPETKGKSLEEIESFWDEKK